MSDKIDELVSWCEEQVAIVDNVTQEMKKNIELQQQQLLRAQHSVRELNLRKIKFRQLKGMLLKYRRTI